MNYKRGDKVEIVGNNSFKGKTGIVERVATDHIEVKFNQRYGNMYPTDDTFGFTFYEVLPYPSKNLSLLKLNEIYT